jgi:hypothetical protein
MGSIKGNPFYRLKQCKPGMVNQEENHCTESLALCLDVGKNLRRKFLELIYPKDEAERLAESLTRIETQTSLTVDATHKSQNRPDLFLYFKNNRGLVVEVKVGQKESSEQLRNYKNTIPTQFDLVSLTTGQHLDQYADAYIKKRITWREIRDAFDSGELEATEKTLVRFLIEHLQESNCFQQSHDTVPDDKQIITIFEEAVNLLPGLQSSGVIKLRKLGPPRIDVGYERWGRIFQSTNVRRILLYYAEKSESWDEFGHYPAGTLFPQLLLGNYRLANKVDHISVKMKQWLPYLNQKGLAVVRDRLKPSGIKSQNMQRNQVVRCFDDLRLPIKFLYAAWGGESGYTRYHVRGLGQDRKIEAARLAIHEMTEIIDHLP